MSKLGHMTVAMGIDMKRVPPSTLQSRLRDARVWRGYTQQDLASELGVGRSTVANYETGVSEPKKLVINAWAVFCDVDVEWLKNGFVPTTNDGDEMEPPPGIDPGTYSLQVQRSNIVSLSERLAA